MSDAFVEALTVLARAPRAKAVARRRSRLARPLQSPGVEGCFFGALLTVVSLSDPAVGLAQVPSPGPNPMAAPAAALRGSASGDALDADAGTDRIRLEEIVPALAGSPLGATPIAEAPPLGRRRTVTRAQVLAALAAADVSARGLAIPARTTGERAVRRLDAEELRTRALPVVAAALAPCAIDELRLAGRADLPPGEIVLRAEMRRPTLTGTSASGFVHVTSGNVTRRIAARARLRCPPPVIAPGRQVRAIITVGRIRATAPAIARQAGRVGDVVRLQNAATGAALRGRVLDADTVELLP